MWRRKKPNSGTFTKQVPVPVVILILQEKKLVTGTSQLEIKGFCEKCPLPDLDGEVYGACLAVHALPGQDQVVVQHPHLTHGSADSDFGQLFRLSNQFQDHAGPFYKIFEAKAQFLKIATSPPPPIE